MIFKKLLVSLEGPLWRIHDLEVESTDQIDGWDDDEKALTLTDFPVSDDEIIDVYIRLGAPNGTKYKLQISGELYGGKEVLYEEKYEVLRNGDLRIIVSENINQLIQ